MTGRAGRGSRMSQDDTIFALSSAPGRAGVAVLRVSGPAAGAALTALAGRLPAPRRATLATLRRPGTAEALDRALVLWFPGPASVTGEDVAELQVHGGRAVIDAVLAALAAQPGLRPAEAGEFARRAFDRGRLDLSEVEGLADLIDAETEAQRRQALRQMDGGLSRLSEGWRAELVGALARLEAAIDFPEEDLPTGLLAAVRHHILCLEENITQYIGNSHSGERLRSGVYVAIIGPPNAGKSSLLNALARRDVAIVSETAGTTRDVIEVHLDLGGYPVILADTAGLREAAGEAAAEAGAETARETAGDAPDPQQAIEAEGMRRARAGAAAADLRLAVFDLSDLMRPGTAPLDPATLALLDHDSLVVLNKCDLVPEPERRPPGLPPGLPPGTAVVTISARSGAGLADLVARLEQEVARRLARGVAAPAVTRLRHRRALEDAVAALARARAAELPELVAEDLRLAARALGRIAGRVDVEEILDSIFREFCIGK